MHDEDRHVFDELALEAQISRGRAIKLAGAAVVAAAFGAMFPDTAEARRRGRRKKNRNRFGFRRGFRNGFRDRFCVPSGGRCSQFSGNPCCDSNDECELTRDFDGDLVRICR
jgi:hypothetical protein